MPAGEAQAGLQGVVIRFAGGLFLEDIEGAYTAIAEGTRDAKVLNGAGGGAGGDAIGTVGSRNGGLRGLIDVVETEQAMALRTNVPEL